MWEKVARAFFLSARVESLPPSPLQAMSANIQTCDCISLATTQLLSGGAVLFHPSCNFFLALDYNQTEVVLEKQLARI